ncbi:hypothetical protein BDY19DRAFT_966593 [Irpex rosettiformis]|uniref:Uncharacterized protein n=1 Tax=Irpex rosettiformis TaxID=378272 RepID=A0ACB8TTL2_9APHY|nr:hypothetical protein BDY19DRAFT_966593 [Irpex rosettiformis]
MKGKMSSQNKGHKGCSRKRCEKRRGKRSGEKAREKGPFLSIFCSHFSRRKILLITQCERKSM